MAILVTGGAGYIGSIAVEKLLAAGERVVVLDDFRKGHRGAVMPEATLVECAIGDARLLEQLFGAHEIEAVMHFAAYIEVGESVSDPMMYFENNIVGAHRVLSAAVQAGVRRFILSSTAAVYGQPERVPITEDAPLRPVNPYGLSKRMVEQMLESHDQAYGLRYVALRYFNACGATELHGEDHHPESHLIPNILAAAEGRRPQVTVFGNDYPTPDGTCVRDYIHVEDLVNAHLDALAYLRAGRPSDAFNLGNAAGISVLEVIEAVKRITGREFPVATAPRRAGDPPLLIACADKARRTLGWQTRRSDIETIVADAWAWRQTHPDGYGDRSK